jgi:multidrug efflux pump subunit AcrA (membrane-fusion protein)
MTLPLQFKGETFVAAAVMAFATMVLVSCGCNRSEGTPNNPQPTIKSTPTAAAATVALSGDQLNAIKIGSVSNCAFSTIKTGIGSIDFENNLYSDVSLSVPVFPPSAGKLLKVFIELGDEVRKGDPLYSLETSGTNHDELIIRSPMAGQITGVNATPGSSVQPSTAPAPCSVADVSTKWLLANVPEAEGPFYKIGLPVRVTVASYPGQVFEGTVTKIYPTVDLTTHRLTIRAQISDPTNELRAGMLADFSVEVQGPVESVAIPENGVVREGDGTMTAWVTTDRRRFTQKIVKAGLRQNGEVQILDGLKTGELAVTDGAIFLDNMLQAPPSD